MNEINENVIELINVKHTHTKQNKTGTGINILPQILQQQENQILHVDDIRWW